MADYQNRKVQIFTGINDQPIAPSSISGGNISHLYSLYNQFINDVEADISNIQAILTAISEQLSEPTLEVFDFPGINTVDDGQVITATVGTIPKTGKLQKIVMNDIIELYDTFFYVNGNVLTVDAYDIVAEGYQWTISNDGSQDVTQGQTITFETISEELNRTVSLHIFG